MKTLAFLTAMPALAVVIDCGSPTDSNFTGGAIANFTAPPGVSDNTVRYGNFRYEFDAENVPYLITFRWIENTVTAKGARLFQVRINDQIVYDRMDLFAVSGYLKPFSRSVVAVGADQKLKIEFITQARNAIISGIEIVPLFQVLGVSVSTCNQAANPGAPTSDCTGLYLVDLPWPSGASPVLPPGGRQKIVGVIATPEVIASPVWQLVGSLVSGGREINVSRPLRK